MAVTIYGFRACECQRATLGLLEDRLRAAGLIRDDLSGLITQGAYNAGVHASAGTHDGGGVWDLSARLGTTTGLEVFRRTGWVAWLRTAVQGFQPHVHAVVAGCPHLAYSAHVQLDRYRRGLNGLAAGGADDGPAVPWTTWRDALAVLGSGAAKPTGPTSTPANFQTGEDDMFTDADRAQLHALYTNAATTTQATELARIMKSEVLPPLRGLFEGAAHTSQAANLADRIDDVAAQLAEIRTLLKEVLA